MRIVLDSTLSFASMYNLVHAGIFVPGGFEGVDFESKTHGSSKTI